MQTPNHKIQVDAASIHTGDKFRGGWAEERENQVNRAPHIPSPLMGECALGEGDGVRGSEVKHTQRPKAAFAVV